ncbi:MAG: hypothetical protein Q4D62_11425 [Planctomycetia bacterium]|nr:hypothetical protein [Planctomycetia bacterium]
MLKYLVTSPVVEILGDELHRIGKHRYGVCEDWIVEKAKAIEANRKSSVNHVEREITDNSPFLFIRPDEVRMKDGSVSFTLPNIPFRLLRYICNSPDLAVEMVDAIAMFAEMSGESTIITAINQDINPALKRNGTGFTLSRKSGFIALKRKDIQKDIQED